MEQEIEQPISDEQQSKRRQRLLAGSLLLLFVAVLQSVLAPSQPTMIASLPPLEALKHPGDIFAVGSILQFSLCALAGVLALLACIHPVSAVKRYGLSIRSTANEERKLWMEDERYHQTLAARLSQLMRMVANTDEQLTHTSEFTLNTALWKHRLTAEKLASLDAILNPSFELLAEDLIELHETEALDELRALVAALNSPSVDAAEVIRLRRRLNARIELHLTGDKPGEGLGALWLTILQNIDILDSFF